MVEDQRSLLNRTTLTFILEKHPRKCNDPDASPSLLTTLNLFENRNHVTTFLTLCREAAGLYLARLDIIISIC
jgi:hypothetical protein